MEADHDTVESPVGEPVVGSEQARLVFLYEGRRFGSPVLVNTGSETNGGIAGNEKAGRDPATGSDETEWDSRAWNGYVSQIIEEVVAIGAFAVVRLVIEIKVGRERVQVNACVLSKEALERRVSRLRGEKGRAVAREKGTPATLSTHVVPKPMVVGASALEELEDRRNLVPHGDLGRREQKL